MKKSLIIILLASGALLMNSCAKSAVCNCTTTEDGVEIYNDTYENAGNDPTCDDWESEEITDSLTTITITCVKVN